MFLQRPEWNGTSTIIASRFQAGTIFSIMLGKILLHDVLVAALAPAVAMHTAFVRLEILFPGLFPARFIRARHQPIAAVSLHMRLDMASWNNLLAAFFDQGTPYFDLIAHVYQQAGHAGRYPGCGGPARRTRELVRVGRAEGGDGRSQTFLAKNVITLELHGLHKGAVADRTH